MLAYAPRPERRCLNPAALALIVGAHAAAIIAVVSAKMDLPERWTATRTDVTLIPLPKPPEPPKPQAQSQSARTSYTAPAAPFPPPPLPGPVANPLPPDPLPPIPGNGASTTPPDPPIVRTGPRFATAPDAIRPPYPDAMRAQEKEAVLRLKLAIDERGRVVAVEPVGKADPTFLAAARRHILKAWRYTPAMEGDRAIPSSTVITLKFELD